MQPYQQRVIDEKIELEGRLTSDEVPDSLLQTNEQRLLRRMALDLCKDFHAVQAKDHLANQRGPFMRVFGTIGAIDAFLCSDDDYHANQKPTETGK